MEENIFLTQIRLVRDNLTRVNRLLQSSALPGAVSGTIYGKFLQISSPIEADLQALETKVRDGAPIDAAAWEEFARLREHAQGVFRQCLDLIGGIAVRDWKLEEGICQLADLLVGYYVQDTGVEWGSVMILGKERLFDEMFHRTRIIRMRFPEWEVWSLPFTGYEFGQLVALGSRLHDLSRLEERVTQEFRELVTAPEPNPALLEGAGEELSSLRRAHQAGADEMLLQTFLGKQRAHLRSLFADAFATWFLGPAYIYARLCLRLVPTEVTMDGPSTPSTAHSIECMVRTLTRMNETDRRDPAAAPGAYRGELERIENLWRSTLEGLYPEPSAVRRLPTLYISWFDSIYEILWRAYQRVGFKTSHWRMAEDLARAIVEDRSADGPAFATTLQAETAARPGVSLAVILNAAWLCRFRLRPDQLQSLEVSVQALFTKAAEESEKRGAAGPAYAAKRRGPMVKR